MLSNTVNKAYALAKKAITAKKKQWRQYLHIWFVRLLSSRQIFVCARAKDEK
jgi:hypothetical protein